MRVLLIVDRRLGIRLLGGSEVYMAKGPTDE